MYEIQKCDDYCFLFFSCMFVFKRCHFLEVLGLNHVDMQMVSLIFLSFLKQLELPGME